MPAEPRSLTRMKVFTDPVWAMERIFELENEVERYEAERKEQVHERLARGAEVPQPWADPKHHGYVRSESTLEPPTSAAEVVENTLRPSPTSTPKAD